MPFNHRYIWSTVFVRNLLRTERLSESAAFGYFLTITAFDWLQFTSIATTPIPSISSWSVASSWLTFSVTVLGLLYLHLKNGGSSGKQFLRRYFPLSVTVGWKFFVSMLLALQLLPVVLAGASTSVVGWSTTTVLAIVNVAMFWRIGFHLSALARGDA